MIPLEPSVSFSYFDLCSVSLSSRPCHHIPAPHALWEGVSFTLSVWCGVCSVRGLPTKEKQARGCEDGASTGQRGQNRCSLSLEFVPVTGFTSPVCQLIKPAQEQAAGQRVNTGARAHTHPHTHKHALSTARGRCGGCTAEPPDWQPGALGSTQCPIGGYLGGSLCSRPSKVLFNSNIL